MPLPATADTPVNGQITDAVTQSLLTVVGSAGAVAVSQSQQVAAQSLGLLVENATAAQQRGQTLADAVVAAGVRLIDEAEAPGGGKSK